MGIKAMQELQKLNPQKEEATAAMCTLLAINTASITLIPTTIIAYRLSMGSVNAAEIVGTTLIATAIATAAAIILDKWFQRKNFPAGKG
ncbi:Spore maturation protein A [compost metagenome]